MLVELKSTASSERPCFIQKRCKSRPFIR